MLIVSLILSLLSRDPCAVRQPPREVEAAIRAEVSAAGGSSVVADYLVAVARRESSLRPWVMHRLPKDVEASYKAWRRLRHTHRARGNPWADRPERWSTIGLFGLNSNYHAWRLGLQVDPRTLCRTSGSVRAYLHAARSALRKMAARKCVTSPRLGDVHRAVQGGRVCPRAGEDLRGPLARVFVSAADFGSVPENAALRR